MKALFHRLHSYMRTPPLLDQVLASWRLNNTVNLLLIQAISAKGLAAVAPDTRGRSVAKQFIHLHQSRCAWLKYNRAPELVKVPLFSQRSNPSKTELKAAFRASGEAIGKFLYRLLTQNKRIKLFQGQPVLWMSYQIAHESHHRGTIILTLKLNGIRLPAKIATDALWYTWYRG